jgi:hypothetical protein
MRSLSRFAVGVLVGATRLGPAPDVESRVLAASRTQVDRDIVREERLVAVGGVMERWRLVWKSQPTPACGPDADAQPGWSTCPCTGFAFGEQGDLELVRVSGTGTEDRLPLTPFFDADVGPLGRTAVLPRWEMNDGDFEALGRAGAGPFAAAVHHRPEVEIMRLRDFDHDGRASEFFVQLGAAPCGKRMGIVVGVSRPQPHLHAFGTARNPAKPLIMRVDHWQALAAATGPMTRVDWRCGDHGSETQEELVLRAGTDGIHVTRRFYGCNADGRRGALMRTEDE